MTEAVARSRKSHWPLALISVLALLTCLFYALVCTFAGSFYSGITFNGEWLIIHIDPCDSHPGWCQANEDGLRALHIGDQLVAIGGLTPEHYWNDRRLVPFDGYGPGESVAITFSRSGQERTIQWEMPVVTAQNRVNHLVSLLFWLPFWLSGTGVFLLLRPRDIRWRMLVLVNYLTAVWVVAGIVSPWGAAASSLTLHAVSWLMAPVYLHLHLLLPVPLLRQRRRYLLIPLYSIAAVLAVLEFLQILPGSAYSLGLVLAILGSLGLLVRGVLDRSSPSVRLAARLMLTGIALAFGPGVVLWLVPQLLNAPAPGYAALAVSTLAIPVMPLFYAYAAFKQYLSDLEFRANRLLGLYSFIVLYTAAFVLVYSIGRQWASRPESLLAFSVAISLVFALAGSPLFARFQRLISRLTYGTSHNPDDLLRVFANRIAASLDREALADLLADELVPSLLIRQSALCLLEDGEVGLSYARGTTLSDVPKTLGQTQQLIQEAGRYRPLRDQPRDAFPWVRLAIPLKTRDRTVGIWLFGRRDPDDFYPQDDITLLTAFGSQAAIATDNARLLDAVSRHRQELARLSARLLDAQEEERKSISRELHDQVGSNLTALSMNLNLILGQLSEPAEVTRSRLEDSLALTEETMERIDELMANLRPSVLDEYGLAAALRWHGAQFASRTNIDVTVWADEGLPRLDLAVENALFRIAQEALTNVARHARATKVMVTLKRRDETTCLVVEDNGVGFDPDQVSVPGGRRGWGMLIMRERAQAIGGSCRIESRPGQGMRVIVRVPA